MKESMIFYRSFYEAIQDLPDAEALQVYNAVFAYGLDFKETELTGIASTVFKLVKPQLDANIRKYQNSLKGGRPRTVESNSPGFSLSNAPRKKPNQNLEETKIKPNQNLEETKTKANGNGNGNLNKNPNSNLNLPVEPVEFLERASAELEQERIDAFLNVEMFNDSIFEETKQKSVIEETNEKKSVSDLSPEMLQFIDDLNSTL